MRKTLFASILMLALATGLMAQGTAITRTTLTSAINDSQKALVVGSATNFLANDVLFIDDEAILVASSYTTGTTIPLANRGYSGTTARSHNAAASILRMTQAQYRLDTPSGACTRSYNPILPVVSISRATHETMMFDCHAGLWVQQSLPDQVMSTPLVSASNIPIGSVAYGSLGTSSALVDGTRWVTSIWVEKTAWITGIQALQGSTAATDSLIGALYDASGKLLANSALAGVLESSANTFKSLPFTSATLVSGPARYYVTVTGNGTTGTIRTVAASTYTNVVGTSATGTFGTLPDPLTIPTTFTADKAPIVQLYN